MPKHNETTLIVFDFIKDFIAERQIAPTIREIAEGCFLGHTSVYRHLDKLELGLDRARTGASTQHSPYKGNGGNAGKLGSVDI